MADDFDARWWRPDLPPGCTKYTVFRYPLEFAMSIEEGTALPLMGDPENVSKIDPENS
jgi:hypothetical protein